MTKNIAQKIVRNRVVFRVVLRIWVLKIERNRVLIKLKRT